MSVDNKSNCEDFQELLDAYFDKELGQEESLLVEEHLHNCSHCLAQLADLKSLMGHLQSLPAPVCPKDFSELIEKRILAEAKADNDKPASATAEVIEGRFSILRASRGLWLAAGLLLIGICLTFALQMPNRPLAQAPSVEPVVAEKPAPEELQIAALPEDRGKRPVLAPGSRVSSNFKRKPESALTSRKPPAADDSANGAPMVAGVVALYDDELYEDGSNLGISTNEDGLYAIKL